MTEKDGFDITIDDLVDELKGYPRDTLLWEENEQLKSVMMEVIDLLTEADLFSDKATEHDTIAYRELKGMDNKDAYTIATATKKAIKQLKKEIEYEF